MRTWLCTFYRAMRLVIRVLLLGTTSGRRRLVVLVLVLVLKKDDLFIKRMLTQKASVYPGFNLVSVVRI